MGRHSAPDDEEGDVVVAPLPADHRPRPGRHARPEDYRDEDADALEAGPATADPALERVKAPARGNQSTADDLELLREHPDVRARVIAAVIAPFVLYTVVLYLIGGMDAYFIWVWLPLVTAGVVAGSILDSAHRRRGRAAG